MRRQLLSVSRRRALQCGATLLGAGAGLPIAAGQAAGPVSAQPLRLVGPWEIGGLAPAQTGYLFRRLGVLETLLETGPEGQPRPGLAQRWQFPDVVVEALQHQSAPLDNNVYEPLAGVIHLASWRARAREADLGEKEMAVSFPGEVGLMLGLDIDMVLQQDPIDWTARPEASDYVV